MVLSWPLDGVTGRQNQGQRGQVLTGQRGG